MQLHAGLAHDIAAFIELKLGRVEHVFTYFTHIANQVRHESIFRIQAAMDHQRFQLRKFVAVRLDEGALIGSDIVLNDDGFIGRFARKP